MLSKCIIVWWHLAVCWCWIYFLFILLLPCIYCMVCKKRISRRGCEYTQVRNIRACQYMHWLMIRSLCIKWHPLHSSITWIKHNAHTRVYHSLKEENVTLDSYNWLSVVTPTAMLQLQMLSKVVNLFAFVILYVYVSTCV